VGVILFLVGFGLLFSYAVQKGWFPLELRLAGAAAVGVAMTAFGWKTRARRRTYSLILQGGGIGVLYIVLLAGAKLEPIIPMAAAILGMLALSFFTVVLALYQNFEPLALFALIGGYAAPILVSSGSSNFVALFSIHSLLNAEILAISLFRDWGKTRWSGLVASFAVGTSWGLMRWQETYFASVEPFLILFFVNYSAIALIPVLSQKTDLVLKNIKLWRYERTDMPMIATIPFILVFLQMAMASHTKYGVALTCLAVGAWYLALGKFAMRSADTSRVKYSHRLFLTYCVIFSNLAIPFVFGQASASAIWGVEGAVLIAFASTRRSSGALACGLLLHAAAFVLYNYAPYLHLPAYLYEIPLIPVGLLSWQDETSPFLLTGLLFALSSLASSYFLARMPHPYSEQIAARVRGVEFKLPSINIQTWFFALYGTIWLVLSVWHAAFVIFSDSRVTAFSMLCLSGMAGYVLSSFSRWKTDGILSAPSPAWDRKHWGAARLLAAPSVGTACVFAAFATVISWILLPIFHYLSYDLFNTVVFEDLQSHYILNWFSMAVMFASCLLSYRGEAATRLGLSAWGFILFSFVSYTSQAWTMWVSKDLDASALGPLVAFLPIFISSALLLTKRFERPVAMDHYRKASFIALTVITLLRLPRFIAGFTPTGGEGFYIPIINAWEFWQLLYLVTAAILLHAARKTRVKKAGLFYALPFVTFFWLNSIAARAAWRYFAEDVYWGHMANAPHFQGIVAMLWGVTSLALIFGGKKYANRAPWFMGAGLLVLDILKLLAIDLRNSATVIRIFAFLLLGGLFLLIGWIAPLPPKKTKPDVAAIGEDVS
jgi:uncharacterized membrane protein